MDEPRIEDAMSFMNDIKLRFRDDEARYKDFLSIMIELKDKGIGDGSIIQKMKLLFEGYEDLLQKFSTFLPVDSGIDLTRAQVLPQVPQPIPNQYMGAIPELPSEQQVATQYVSLIKERFASDNNHTYNRFMTILQEYQTGVKEMAEVVSEIVTLFQGHDDLIQRFIQFLPLEYQVNVSLIINKLNQAQQMQYRQTVYEQPVYQNYEANRRKPRTTRQTRSQTTAPVVQPVAPVAPVAVSQPAIQPTTRRSRRFIEEEPEVESDSIPLSDRRFFDRVVKREIPSEVIYHQFLQLLDLYNKDVLPLNELFSALTDLLHLRHPVLAQLRTYLSNKGISEEAMSHTPTVLTWDQIHSFTSPTPSYHILPSQIPRRVGSQRSYADSLVLNDNLVSQTIGSEDFSYSHMRRNQYEEALFRCEDDRFEADVILETTHSAIAQLELLQHEMEEMEEGDDGNYRLRDDSLSAVQLGAIRRVYNQNGIDKEVIKLLFMNPKDCIPRILERLRAKEKEWIEEKVILNERCREVQKQNYYLSLDHRSFYFRQQDKKDITTKVLVDMIKENAAKESVKKEDGDSSHRFDEGEAHIRIQLTDRSIHKQVIRLLLVAAKKQFTKTEMERFKMVLHELVISFFHLTPNFIDSAEMENSGVQYMEGTAVSIPQGEGVIQSYDPTSKLYTIAIGDSQVELPRRSILIRPPPESGSEDEENEGSGIEEAPLPEKEGIESPEEEVPIQVECDEPVLPATTEMMFGGNTVYVFYRLYCLLYVRLQKSKELCESELYTEQNMTAHVVERAVDDQKEACTSRPSANERFIDLMDIAIQLLRGEFTNQQFEQNCRQILGTSGYFLFTLDRVVMGCIRQIQSILNETVSLEVISLHNYLKQQGGIRPTLYLHNTLRLIGDSRVNLFRMEYVEKEGVQKDEGLDGDICFWYVGCVHDLERPAGTLSDAFYQYAEEYLRQTAVESSVEEHVDASSPFLTRSKAKALNEKEHKAGLDEVDEFIPDQYDSDLIGKGGRKRKSVMNDDEVVSKKAK